MEPQTLIVLTTAMLMIVLFITGKFSYGLITMTCCALLCLTGVYDVSTAFSGLTNKMVILISTMFVLGAAFGKTSLTAKLKKWMILMNGKKGILLVAMMVLITIVMVQFMSVTVTLTLMTTFIATLGGEGEVTPSKIMMPLLMVSAGWACLTPIGMGATTFMIDNGLISGFVTNEAHLFKIFDYCKVAIIPAMVLTVYCLFIWRKIPNQEVNADKLGPVKEDVTSYAKWQEILVYILFFGVFIILVFFPAYVYIAPVLAVLVLAYTKIMSLKEIVAVMAGPNTWMIAGVLMVATALGDSGAGDMIGNAIISLLGGTTNGLFIMIVFAVVAILMTTFLSNTGTYMILMPIAASVAVAGGMDPRGLCIVVSVGCNIAFAFPTGSGGSALIYSAAGYNPLKIAKFTLPAVVLVIASLVLSANLWFPLYG